MILFADRDWYGRDTVTLSINDGFDTAASQVPVDVLPVNDAPQFLNFPDSTSVINDQILEIGLDGYLTDIDSDVSKLEVEAEYDSAQLLVNYDTAKNILQVEAKEYIGPSTLLIKVKDDSSAYSSQLLVVDIKVITSLLEEVSAAFDLKQNFPNPFQQTTTVPVQTNVNGKATINIYDLSGNKVHVLYDGYLKKGSHEFEFNANDLTNGIYLYSFESDYDMIIKKMIISR